MEVVIGAQLSERQRQLLFRVVEEYVATRQPVGSKTLVARGRRIVLTDRGRFVGGAVTARLLA